VRMAPRTSYQNWAQVSKWLPDLRYADQVTLGQLAQMTSGYADYVASSEMSDAQYAFRQWTPEELIAYSTKQPLIYKPGTNWNSAKRERERRRAVSRQVRHAAFGLVGARPVAPLACA
jgi:Beta-lactamase